MKRLLPLFLMTAAAGTLAAAEPVPSPRDLRVLVVMGSEGAAEYKPRFVKEAESWKKACEKARVACEVVGVSPEQKEKPDLSLMKQWVETAAQQPDQPVWVVLIGHGTFDGREAKFNLRGPDLTPQELASWMKPLVGEVAVIQTASSSAPFLKALAGPKRVLISATKSADEVFYTRFGQFFAEAVSGSPEPDLDQDGQVSLLEAFLWASKQVDRFFATEGRLATEHALLEDNGDGVGSRADSFDGLRAAKVPADGKIPDGQVAKQWSLLLSPDDALMTEEVRKHRGELERHVEALRAKKGTMAADAYYAELEKLLLEIAKIYETVGDS